MCLISNTAVPSIAKEDIFVWKVLTKSHDTPFRDIKVNILVRLGIIPFKAKGDLDVRRQRSNDKNSNPEYQISGGMIHTFATQREALYLGGCNSNIYLCIIPKGTEYFKSTDSREYCSKKIKFIKKVF